ncbi:MAG: Gfo/Idh/MocA family oxidoreductase, partial [Chloroflexi bacterium]|nr:Gfo/Idh/MocA family oxidoreductase [Chloroflexota bacterium]
MARDLNVGIIGYDTSHAPAFVRLLNREDDPFHVAGARVVAGYPSFSEDLQFSVSRKEGFRAELSELGVREVCCIEDLLSQVDAVLLESVDGRRHLSEVKPVFAARKPVFIDKPLAASLSDAQEIVRLARDSGTPMFSASSLRYDVNVLALQNALAGGPVYGCDAFSPATLDATNPGLFWYGVHGVETLYAFLGRGC